MIEELLDAKPNTTSEWVELRTPETLDPDEGIQGLQSDCRIRLLRAVSFGFQGIILINSPSVLQAASGVWD